MKGGILDVIMYLFILVAVLAALKNPRGFATDVTATGHTATEFGTGLLGQIPSS